jgi:hypothetical protein
MELEVLAVRECPHVAEFEERLSAALAGIEGVVVRRRVIEAEAEAAAAGMHGSPTLLVNGVDPLAAPGQPTSLSCKLAVPSVDELRRVLTAQGGAGAGRRDPGGSIAGPGA